MRDSAKPLIADSRPRAGTSERVMIAPDPLLGTTIDDRYHIESLLGEGGMGLIYRATHTSLRKPLAIKILRPDVSRDDEVLQRFRQEAQSASAIGNQHIVDVSDFGMLPDGSTYFVMEYLDGTDLIHVIEDKKRLPPELAIHIAKQVSRALSAAHAEGIVHRDLKPENIYLIRRGRETNFVKVLDFGIAKVGSGTSRLTRAGEVFGTPHYMSPEQCAGTEVDHRTDIYALGVMLYEMVTGEVPHDADNMMGILTKHIYEEPLAPSRRNFDLPPGLEQVILRCMHKDISVRYQSMADVEADLLRVESGQEVIVPEALLKKRSRVPWVFALTGLVSLALLIALLVAALDQDAAAPSDLATHAILPVAVLAPPPAALTVPIVSVPDKAEVWEDKTLLGVTPLELKPSAIAGKTLVLRHAGYEPTPQLITADTDVYEVYLKKTAAKAPAKKPKSTGRSKATHPKPPPPEGETLLNPWSAD